MNTLVRMILAGALAGSLLPAQTVRGRERAQQARIAEGVRSGELTGREAARLERNEARLRRQIRRDRADGGGLSARERAKIDRRQDRLDRQIRREKHDRQVQPR